MRYPAVPLVVHDPYLSIWSFRDTLYGGQTLHWTGKSNCLYGLIHIDGKCYSYMGDYHSCPFVNQKSVEVTPCRTIYTFEVDGIELKVTFLTPALPHKLEILSRPATYIIYDIKSIDGRPHKATVVLEHSGNLCVDHGGDKVDWGRLNNPDMELLHISANEQRVLEHVGDDLRIEWGRSILCRPLKFKGSSALGRTFEMRKYFVEHGKLPPYDYAEIPCSAGATPITAAAALDFDIPAEKTVSAFLISAYHDGWSIEYLTHRLKGYWTLSYKTFQEMISAVFNDFETLYLECRNYDEQLTQDIADLCGEDFSELCALAFRQAIGAHKLVASESGEPLFFSKENFSNGCIATVDVTYPSSPLFILTNKALVKGMMTPILEYAATPNWKHDFAPHDLGTYPVANNQIYRGGEFNEHEQMPIEECGNMLILAGALLKFHNDLDYIKRFFTQFKLWAEYLIQYGFDPDNQLCTDDFAGHLAHNANLSLKAIIAMGAWAQICDALGDKNEAERFRCEAEKSAVLWQKAAFDGDHYRLAFDQPGSWSQKYNLVWDKLLELELFDPSVSQLETAFYLTKINQCGLPLDNRETYTKLDWIVWSATLSGKKEDFQALTAPLITWLNTTPTRVPLNDWFDTIGGAKMGFQARSVVGGLFIPMLYNSKLCKKYKDMVK